MLPLGDPLLRYRYCEDVVSRPASPRPDPSALNLSLCVPVYPLTLVRRSNTLVPLLTFGGFVAASTLKNSTEGLAGFCRDAVVATLGLGRFRGRIHRCAGLVARNEAR